MCEENVPLAESPGVWADVSCRSRAVGSSVAGATVDMTVDYAVVPSVNTVIPSGARDLVVTDRDSSHSLEMTRHSLVGQRRTFVGRVCTYRARHRHAHSRLSSSRARLYNAARAGWAPYCLSRSQTDL